MHIWVVGDGVEEQNGSGLKAVDGIMGGVEMKNGFGEDDCAMQTFYSSALFHSIQSPTELNWS